MTARICALISTFAAHSFAAPPADATVLILRGPACGSVLLRWSTHSREAFSSARSFLLAALPLTGPYVQLFANESSYVTHDSAYASPGIWTFLAERLTPAATYSLQLWPPSPSLEFVVPSCAAASGAPVSSDVSPTLFFTGDVGQGLHASAVMNAMRARLRPPGTLVTAALAASSVLLVGDISYADGTPSGWDVFQTEAQPVFASGVPVAVLPGNHDVVRTDDIVAYDARFVGFPEAAPSPGSGEAACIAGLRTGWQQWQPSVPGHFGSFSSGPFHVIHLCEYAHCTEGATPDAVLGVAQSTWLQQELACRVDRSATPFLLVALHAPLYHSNLAHVNEPLTVSVRTWLEPLLLSYGVDAVLAGHVHAYEVTHPLAFGEVSPCSGMRHITQGTGGNYEGLYDFWASPTPSWSLFRNGRDFSYSSLRALNRSHAVLTQVGKCWRGRGKGRMF
jgi:hypothetical protein